MVCLYTLWPFLTLQKPFVKCILHHDHPLVRPRDWIEPSASIGKAWCVSPMVGHKHLNVCKNYVLWVTIWYKGLPPRFTAVNSLQTPCSGMFSQHPKQWSLDIYSLRGNVRACWIVQDPSKTVRWNSQDTCSQGGSGSPGHWKSLVTCRHCTMVVQIQNSKNVLLFSKIGMQLSSEKRSTMSCKQRESKLNKNSSPALFEAMRNIHHRKSKSCKQSKPS